MSALSHYMEDEGLPTAGISLVRENTEGMRPPRALWVPFPLGRPFGAPREPAFQARVLRDVLALLARADGPVILADFPDDAPGQAAALASEEPLVCPVSFPAPPREGEPALLTAVLAEVASLQPWHNLFRERLGRAGGGVSGLSVEEAAGTIAAFIETGQPPEPAETAPVLLRNAAEDLRTWYMEAMASQPGEAPSPTAMADWFWGETAAGRLLLALQPVCLASEDRLIRQVGRAQLVPRAQQHRL